VVAAIAGIAGGAFMLARGQQAVISTAATAIVTRGTLVITVQEDGEVEAEKREVIANSLRWPVIIDDLVADGTVVEANEIIVKFSCKELDDAAVRQEKTVRDANSDHEQALANSGLKTQEVAEKLRKSEQAVVDANEAYHRYLEGEWPIKLREEEEDIRLKKRNLDIMVKDLKFKKDTQKELGDKSPYTQSEIESDELKLARSRLDLAKAESQYKMLIKYDHPKETRRLDNAVKDTELALKRARVDTKLELRRAKEQVSHRQRNLELQTKELNKLREEQAKLTVKAKKKGLVVYDTRRWRWDRNNTVVAKGEKIGHRQQIMIIPDMTTLAIHTKVFEAMSDLVKPGLKATVRLETDQQNPIPAKVFKVSALPEKKSWHNSAVTFNVVVKLDKIPKALRPNMTAKVELELMRLEDVVKVPVAAVFWEQDKAYCWQRDRLGRKKKVHVEVGEANDREVEIKSGLKPGDRVCLIEPEGLEAPSQATESNEGAGGLLPG